MQNDLETWLAEREMIPWSVQDPERQRLSAVKIEPFDYGADVLHEYWTYLHRQRHRFDPWLASEDPATVANALIVLIERTTALLRRQMESQEESFVRDGGIREKMHKARTAAAAGAEGAPACPECGEPMRRRHSARGDFWGCSGYPECKATRAMERAP